MLRPHDVLPKARTREDQHGHSDTSHVDDLPHREHGSENAIMITERGQAATRTIHDDDTGSIEEEEDNEEVIEVYQVQQQDVVVRRDSSHAHLYEMDINNNQHHRHQTNNVVTSASETNNSINKTNTSETTTTTTNTSSTTYNINIERVKSLHFGAPGLLSSSTWKTYLSWMVRTLLSLGWHVRVCIAVGVAIIIFRYRGFLSSTVWTVAKPAQWLIQAVSVVGWWSGLWSQGGDAGGTTGTTGTGEAPPRITPTPRPEPSIPSSIKPLETVLPPLLWQDALRGSLGRIKQLDLQQDGRTSLTDLVGQMVDQTATFSTDFAARVTRFTREHARQSTRILQRAGQDRHSTLAILQRQAREVELRVHAVAVRRGEGRTGWAGWWTGPRASSSPSSAAPGGMGKDETGGLPVHLATHAEILWWLDNVNALLQHEATTMQGWLGELEAAKVGATAAQAAREMCTRARAVRGDLRGLEAARAVGRHGGGSSSGDQSGVDVSELRRDQLVEIRSTANTGCMMGQPCQEYSDRQIKLLRTSLEELEDKALASVGSLREEVLDMMGGDWPTVVGLGPPWWGDDEKREARRILRVQEGTAVDEDEEGDVDGENGNGGGGAASTKLLTGEKVDSIKLGVYKVLKARRDSHEHIFGQLVEDGTFPGR